MDQSPRLSKGAMNETFYTTDLSPFGARLRLVNAFTGWSPQEQAPPDGAGSEAMRTISVFGKVPAIIVDDHALVESLALMEYGVERAGGSELVPEDIVQRARMRGMMLAFDHHVLGAIWPMFIELRSGDPDMAVVKAALDDATAQASALTRLLDDEGFALGARVSLADLAMAPFAQLLGRLYPAFGETTPFATQARLADWWRCTSGLPEVDRVMQVMDGAFVRAYGSA